MNRVLSVTAAVVMLLAIYVRTLPGEHEATLMGSYAIAMVDGALVFSHHLRPFATFDQVAATTVLFTFSVACFALAVLRDRRFRAASRITQQQVA
jgi:hypothetical protein